MEEAPFFNVPSCVLFTERARGSPFQISLNLPTRKEILGKLNDHNSNLMQVQNKLKIKDTKYFYKTLGSASAFSNKNNLAGSHTNAYKDAFSQEQQLYLETFTLLSQLKKL